MTAWVYLASIPTGESGELSWAIRLSKESFGFVSGFEIDMFFIPPLFCWSLKLLGMGETGKLPLLIAPLLATVPGGEHLVAFREHS